MGSLHKNIQLMLEFFKGSFLVLHYCYYTLMTFLVMFYVLLLSILMLLLSLLIVIRHLICGKKKWLLNLNQIYNRLGQEVACGFQCWKNSNGFDQSNNAGAIDVKMVFPKEKSCFKMLGLAIGLLHYLYCENCLQKNWSLDLLYEVFFS